VSLQKIVIVSDIAGRRSSLGTGLFGKFFATHAVQPITEEFHLFQIREWLAILKENNILMHCETVGLWGRDSPLEMTLAKAVPATGLVSVQLRIQTLKIDTVCGVTVL
jgi:hypothetical protein